MSWNNILEWNLYAVLGIWFKIWFNPLILIFRY